MKVTGFEWDGRNQRHIWRHRVSFVEAEEVFEGRYFYERGRDGYNLAYGVTAEGRYLFVVFFALGQGVIRVVTARNMTDTEKRRYKHTIQKI